MYLQSTRWEMKKKNERYFGSLTVKYTVTRREVFPVSCAAFLSNNYQTVYKRVNSLITLRREQRKKKRSTDLIFLNFARGEF